MLNKRSKWSLTKLYVLVPGLRANFLSSWYPTWSTSKIVTHWGVINFDQQLRHGRVRCTCLELEHSSYTNPIPLCHITYVHRASSEATTYVVSMGGKISMAEDKPTKSTIVLYLADQVHHSPVPVYSSIKSIHNSPAPTYSSIEYIVIVGMAVMTSGAIYKLRTLIRG